MRLKSKSNAAAAAAMTHSQSWSSAFDDDHRRSMTTYHIQSQKLPTNFVTPTLHHEYRHQQQNRYWLSSATNPSSFSSSPISLDDFDLTHKDCNVTKHIASKIGRNLHLQANHPLCIIRQIITKYFQSRQQQQEEQVQNVKSGPSQHRQALLHHFSNISPIVSTMDSFDSLLIPQDHISRSPSDTYYLNPDTVLRPHTSAHQQSILQDGYEYFLVTGDVYRRDDIDSSHYPIFHQMEGVKVFHFDDYNQQMSEEEQVEFVLNDLKQNLEGLAKHLFGQDVPMRWVDAYFPFTHPSLELEIYLEDHKQDDGWLEVLGCGVMQPKILQSSGRIGSGDASSSSSNTKAWAFGLGLERLAMVLFDIPDIRLFWSNDARFLQQFETVNVESSPPPSPDGKGVINTAWKGKLPKFEPYSKYPPVFKDIAFWLPNSATTTNEDTANSNPNDDGSKNGSFHVQDLNELVREIAGDLVEEVTLVDEFVHPKTSRCSHCYRITYRSMDRSLTNSEIDKLQETLRALLPETCHGIELR